MQSVKGIIRTGVTLNSESRRGGIHFYPGVQATRLDWSNIFLSENYLKMYVG